MTKTPIYIIGGIGAYALWRAYILTRDDGSLTVETLSSDFLSTVQTGFNLMTEDFTKHIHPVDPETGIDYTEIIRREARANYVPPLLLAALLKQESQFKASATGPMTRYGRAKGMAQFIDTTATEWGLTNPYDGVSAIKAAARYIKWLYGQAGTWRKAVAAYNWGIGNVRKYGLSAMPSETRNYVSVIYDRYKQYLPE